jgi:hypothetical protein
MKFRPSGILGLALSDRTILCAQASAGGTADRVGRFALPAGVSLDQPAALGAALKAFLAGHGLAATHAVVGLPAKWLIAQEREVPPTNLEQAHSVLRLQAERIALGDGHELVFDYAGDIATTGTANGKVLLVGVLKQRLDRVAAMAEAAGLKLAAVTATPLVLSQRAAGDGPVLVLGEQGAEMVLRRAGVPTGVRHLAGTGIAAVSGEVRRAVALGGGTGRELSVWDGTGQIAPGEDADGKFGCTVRVEKQLAVDAKALNGDADRISPAALTPAVALALAGVGKQRLPVDFADSRLAPPPVKRFGKWAVYGAVAAVLVVGGLIALYSAVLSKEAELDDLNAQLKAIDPDVKSAREVIARFNFMSGYFGDKRPAVLECLRDVTLVYNESDPIWTTSFTLKENMRGTLQGKATSLQTVYAVRDRLQNNPKFKDVTLKDSREVGNRSRDVTFTIDFRYVGAKETSQEKP